MSDLQHQRIDALCQVLRLGVLASLYGPIAQDAAKRKNASYADFLEEALRAERLNEEVFDSLAHARRVLARWRHDYNHHRPHSSLGGLTPAARQSLELVRGIAPGALATPTTMHYERAGLSI